MKTTLLIPLAASLLSLSLSTSVALDQIYVACKGTNSIKAFTIDGTPIGSGDLISGLSSPNGIVLVGTTLFVTGHDGGWVGAYSTSGATIDATFSWIGLGAYSIATNGVALWVSNVTANTVNVYSTTTGLPLSTPPLVSGLQRPRGVAVSGNVLYIADTDFPAVKSFNATTGAALTYSTLGLDEPRGIAVSGNRIYVSNFGSGEIGVYDATTCNPIDASFITGLGGPIGLKVKGNTLYVAETSAGKIRTYDATTGTLINASLISGLNNPYDLAITPDPVVPVPTLELLGKKALKTTKGSILLKGTSANAVRVEAQVGGKAYRSARGISSWKYNARLAPGKNTVLIRAANAAGIFSPSLKVKIRRN